MDLGVRGCVGRARSTTPRPRARSLPMGFDDSRVGSRWDPWNFIPPEYNLGEALTRGQVEAGRGGKVAIVWEYAARASRSLTYAELDATTSRLASSLVRLGVKHGDRVFLRLPNIPEFYVAAL